MFQDRKHILILTTGYTGASENTECLLWSTSVKCSKGKYVSPPDTWSDVISNWRCVRTPVRLQSSVIKVGL